MAYIIAEIGFNHEGDLGLAGEMISAAATAGANAVKFQTFRAGDILLPTSQHYDGLKKAEMSLNDHLGIAEHANREGVAFLSTAFSAEAVALLEEVGVAAHKVASMDCTNHPLLEQIAVTGKPVYVSTGMASPQEIGRSLAVLDAVESGPVTLLHCLSLYPAGSETLNLAMIPWLRQEFGRDVGYSDHFIGVRACLAAVMMGATVVETHFTLDTSRPGGDHAHSADPDMLAELVREVALFESMRGSSEAGYARPDRPFAAQFRRGLHAARLLKKGERLTAGDVSLARPSGALGPNDLEAVLGRTLSEDVPAHHPIEPRHLNP